MTILKRASELLPGVVLVIVVTVSAQAAQYLEIQTLGRAWLESIVLAILVGTIVRSLWTPPRGYFPGINFSAKTLLEVAVMLLGASISTERIMEIGPALVCGIAGVVVVALAFSYGLGRLFGLSKHVSLLVASGNSICGNSAIAAVAPVIGAKPADIATSIAFTAVLGVVVVIALPFLIPVLQMSHAQYGVLAGLTVYAVPQVLAATMPVGAIALQIGTIVKLVRVLMLGPLLVALSVTMARRQYTPSDSAALPARVRWAGVVPWFIIGFILLSAARSAGLIPKPWLVPTNEVSTLLTIVSMAALGLGVDVRTVARAGTRVIVTVTGSLLLIAAIAIGMIHALGVS
jgi:uncharacterized integral membrane protein (TIGR00698 family)